MILAAGVVLAAGRSSRYRAAGGTAPSKLVEPVRGEPLVRHAATAALRAGLAPLLVVTGHVAEAVGAALAGLPVRLVPNPDFAAGLASSLATGLAAVPPDREAAAVLLGDMPLVRPSTIEALLRALSNDPSLDAAVPVVGPQKGNPVVLRRSLFAATAALDGDEGARRLLRSPAVRVGEVPVDDPAALLDVDDPAAFEGLGGAGVAGA